MPNSRGRAPESPESRIESLERRQARVEILLMQLVAHGREGVDGDTFYDLMKEVEAFADQHPEVEH